MLDKKSNMDFTAEETALLSEVDHFQRTTLQWCALENQQSPFYVVNEVTLRGQNLSLKFCYPLEV